MQWDVRICTEPQRPVASLPDFILRQSGVLGGPNTFSLSINCSSRILVNSRGGRSISFPNINHCSISVRRFSFCLIAITLCTWNSKHSYRKWLGYFINSLIQQLKEQQIERITSLTLSRSNSTAIAVIKTLVHWGNLCAYTLSIITLTRTTLGIAWNEEEPMGLLNASKLMVWHKLEATILKKNTILKNAQRQSLQKYTHSEEFLLEAWTLMMKLINLFNNRIILCLIIMDI